MLEEEGFVDVLREQPPPRLKQLYAEKHCKVPLCYAVPTVPLCYLVLTTLTTARASMLLGTCCAYRAYRANHTGKVRVYVYTAHGLRTKASGEKPQPFLKVFNGLAPEQVHTTRDRPLGSTLSPEFHASFELSADLPGESLLHVQVSVRAWA